MKCIHTIHIRKPIRTAVAVFALAAVPAGAVAVPTYAAPTTTTTAAAGCATGWGSLPEASTWQGPGQLTNVRTGRHPCFDRIVFDVKGKPSWYRVNYVPNVYTVGEGKLIPLRGGAKLQIVLLAPSYDDDGRPTYKPADYDELTNVSGYRTFRQVVSAGSFEGETVIGVGVRARLPFRVFTLTGSGTGRIVVDVAHTW
ncbi:AMIN-like domain-containing (lipo)protein [Kribbella sp. CA-294648]|uniref:AMIN-like domain-containing (lipo)protein n=1 Tax=Kribbella sp. CA-294648 TaxID=3239948 RepID=UPI003D91F4CF